MGTEQVSFLAGKDPLGDNVWIPASVEDREERDDGEWLYVLPAFSDSEDSATWVKASEVRPITNRAAEPDSDPPSSPPRLRVVR
ncbi:hypothetical protein [Microlunatus soli]|nr:hypothetical protein [Microlunatus soli]